MHIVHVTHRVWPVQGGSERYVIELARRQVAEGHRVTVVATTVDALSGLWTSPGQHVSLQAQEEYLGVRILRLIPRYLPCGSVAFPVLRRIVRGLAPRFPDLAMTLGRFAPWLPQLRLTLGSLEPDLLFAWNITLESLSAAVADHSARHHKPWIAVPLLHLARPLYTMRHQLRLLSTAHRVLAQTEAERRYLIGAGIDPGRVGVVSPGVELADSRGASGARFRDANRIDDRTLVVSVGALGYEKGTLHLLRACRRLWKDGIPLELALVGRLSWPIELVLRSLPYGLRSRCHVFRNVSESDKWDIIAASDIVALPSRTESFGMVFLEAWALQKPVIGACSGAVESVVSHGVDGMLVSFGDVQGLVGALKALIDQPGLASEMGVQGYRKVASEYTWEHQYRRLREVVRELIAEQ